MKQKKKRRYVEYNKANYEKNLKHRTQSVSFNHQFVEMGLSKEAVEQAAKDLNIAVNAWWNLAAVLALSHPEAVKRILRGQKS